MKVKLLNDGGYDGLNDLDYNTIFEASNCYYSGRVEQVMGVEITVEDLVAAGAKESELPRIEIENRKMYFSIRLNEYEVVL